MRSTHNSAGGQRPFAEEESSGEEDQEAEEEEEPEYQDDSDDSEDDEDDLVGTAWSRHGQSMPRRGGECARWLYATPAAADRGHTEWS